MWIVLLVLGIVLFIGLVIVHEFGHFLAARRNGVDIEEFGIGFPPRAWKRKTKKGFIFSLNWLPIGGFVRLKGENDAASEKGSFGAASFGVKTKIMLAGVAMNLAVAFVLLTIVALIGMPKILDDQFTVASDTKIMRNDVLAGHVEPGSPAEKAGLKTRDQLISIQGRSGGDVTYYDQDGQTILFQEQAPLDEPERLVSGQQLPELTKRYAGQEIIIVYQRDGKQHTTNATLRTAEEVNGGRAYLGVVPAEFTLQRSTWSAPIVALGLMKQFTIATFQGLGTAITALFQGDAAKASEQVSGPVGIVAVLKEGSLLGYQFILFVIAVISLSLALMNILPIPALDGGRFYVLLLSRIFGRKLSQAMEERIVGASFVFLLILIVLITIVDVRRL